MKVLVLGATGMLGSAVFRIFCENSNWKVYGTVRSESSKRIFPSDVATHLICGVDVEQHDSLIKVFAKIRPNVVINCIGLVKQLDTSEDPLQAIPINALLPHRLSQLCELVGARLIHISTDCVFSGKKGSYYETDPSDAEDLYGRSKYLGEVSYSHAVTLRTSIIGHEMLNAHGLVEWFLAQQESCKGYTKAIFSGLPTIILAKIIRDVVIPRPDLSGVYHVASRSISKYDLLTLIASIYEKQIMISPDERLVIDRSLNADRFSKETGYIAPEWPELIKMMHAYR